MAAVGYTIVTGGAVALTAVTAKSILGVKAHAHGGMIHSGCKPILMGGGIDGPEYINKQVWVSR